ncbi:MAG: hypothetical protein ACFCVD_23910 [Nodosilinea sp.]
MTRSNEERKFERYYDVLANDLINASHHSQLYWMINRLIREEYSREINQSGNFWRLILESLETSSILALSRVYDEEKNKAFHLKKFLDFTGNNLHIFEKEAFITRLKNDDRKWEALLDFSQKPSKDQLENDKKLISSGNPVVNKLTRLRSHVVAHTNEKLILGSPAIKDPPTWDTFNELLERGFGILNHYRISYDGQRIDPQDGWDKRGIQLVFKRLKISSLALDFVNLKYRSSDTEDLMNAIYQFVKEVAEEIYKQ